MSMLKRSLLVHVGLTTVYFGWLFGCATKTAEDKSTEGKPAEVAAQDAAHSAKATNTGNKQKTSKVVKTKNKLEAKKSTTNSNSQVANTQTTNAQAANMPKSAAVKTESAAPAASAAPSTSTVTANATAAANTSAANKVEASAAVSKTENSVTPLRVTANAVNIRSQPNKTAKIVGKLTRGTTLPVHVEGQWAKLGENQYVLAKYLATND